MLLEVVARARRRLWWNAFTLQLAVAACVGLAAFVLLLLLGTDLVDTRWPVILPLSYLAMGLWIARRRLPAPRAAAQMLDARLSFPDTLSTAVHFADPGVRNCNEEFRRAQSTQAAEAVARINLRALLPLRCPRALYLSAGLAVAAAGLFVVRYQSAARLDLRQPLAGIVQQMLETARTEVAKLVDELQQFVKDPKLAENQRSDQKGSNTDGEQSDEKASNNAEANPGDSNAGTQAEKENAKADTFAGEEEQSEQGQQGNQIAAESDSGSQQQQRNAQAQNEGQTSRQQPQSAGSQSASSASGSSMMNKIKDSMANLLSALKPQPGGAAGQQQMKAQDGRPNGSNGRKQGSTESAAANGDPGQGDSPKPGNAKAAGMGQAGKAESDKQQGTGAGTEEGSKDIRAADELAAMGKLNALFGKRAENVSGEFTVEKPSGPQSLQTPYTQRAAQHSSVETAAVRDEVPVAFQDYVRHYYELVRQEDGLLKRSPRVTSAPTRRPRIVR